ncbi:MAG: diphthamide synthesis protein [Nanoarchaeota archaeon]
MKTLFLEAKYKGKIDLKKIDACMLPLKIGLATTVQFVDHLDDIEKTMVEKDKEISVGKGKQKYRGQVLGCDVSAASEVKDKVDAFLYIGTGQFHPIKIKLETGKEVFVFNPVSSKFTRLDDKIVENYKKRKKGALLKFFSSKNIGILVSVKPGQNYDARKLDILENKYKDKKFYVFVADTIDYVQLENFPFVDAWVNTACPRMEEDVTMVNISEI